ncbi:MAG: NYN domain-containing protein [Gammaproteobacteria bacterium]|nr:NYN domain-containing protein [Gammaproteobacteria bacterium]
MGRYAVLIDAGFLKRKLASRESPLSAASVGAFVRQLGDLPALRGSRLHRVYFYDAPPLRSTERKPLSGGSVSFSNTSLARNNQRLHRELRDVPFVALRMGELRFRGWALSGRRMPPDAAELTVTSEDLLPNVQQKGVDMRVGLDIASLTLKRQVEIIVLVTGDSDFIPAMKFARREGAQLFLVALGHNVLDEMREHADLMLDLD